MFNFFYKVFFMEIKKIRKNVYLLKKEFGMNLEPKIFANEQIISVLKEETINKNNSLSQLKNISSLPGLEGVVCLADIHPGYGAPIGTATASNLKEGVITFAATGFDINCGVHSLVLPFTAKEIEEKNKILADALFKEVPAGVGVGGKLKLNKTEMDDLLENGAEYVIKKGFGNKKDLSFFEEQGKIKKVDSTSVSDKAKERACDQIGTLGSGNHYCEVQKIEKIFDDLAAKKFGLTEGKTFVSIHCGSRAIGHQIGNDYLPLLDSAVKKYNIKINDRGLVCAPFNSEEGQKYFSAINAGTNAAFANRQVIGTLVKRTIAKVFECNEKEIKTFYDVGHNTAKIETHFLNGKKQKVLVQRKGSTRGFGPNNSLVPSKYRSIGQPVIVGGSMGTNSFILKGTKTAMSETFGSTIHGAGRSMSRSEAMNNYAAEELLKSLNDKGIIIKARSLKGLSEESPDAYKDILQVVKVMNDTRISRITAKLSPLICIKG
jgi:tRNA-splicing ligase RtcB